MFKERLLTVRWNNLFSVGLAIPTIAYAVVALATSVLSDRAGFIGIAVLAALY